jgi:hypothetical protein
MTPVLYFKKQMFDNMFFKRIEASKKIKTTGSHVTVALKRAGIVSISLICFLAHCQCQPISKNKVGK